MNNIELARSNVKQAEERLKHAREALESGNYPYVIRQCQEAVELALKARAINLYSAEPLDYLLKTVNLSFWIEEAEGNLII